MSQYWWMCPDACISYLPSCKMKETTLRKDLPGFGFKQLESLRLDIS